MFEPANLWVGRVVARFKDRAPRMEPVEGKAGVSLVAPGIRPFPIASLSAAGRSGEALKQHYGSGYEAARPSGWDPVERIKDQDVDGVCAEVLYTSLGMPLFGLADAELQYHCFKVYNDWLAEFCSHNPKRLIGIALIALNDIGQAVTELERCARAGLRGAMIWGFAHDGRTYSSKEYETFLATDQNLAMPMEMRGLLAQWDGARLTVNGGAKVLFFNRRTLAKQMGLPEDAVELIENDVGGGFGARGEFYP
jgi:hypothetical protein